MRCLSVPAGEVSRLQAKRKRKLALSPAGVENVTEIGQPINALGVHFRTFPPQQHSQTPLPVANVLGISHKRCRTFFLYRQVDHLIFIGLAVRRCSDLICLLRPLP